MNIPDINGITPAMKAIIPDMTGIVPDIYDELPSFKPDDLAMCVRWLKDDLAYSQRAFDMEIATLDFVFDVEARQILVSKYHIPREEVYPYTNFLVREYMKKLKQTFEESGAGVWGVYVGTS